MAAQMSRIGRSTTSTEIGTEPLLALRKKRLRRQARVPPVAHRRDYSQPLRMNSTIE
ncbi:hypothetical protein [Burkholderia contaminans]|uniref:hypothetical protein n=1 Tax=Burkholderia contaminans TaxID=488447 RepID=UPI0015814B6B|nr:hypothetical protein [Burkholderia contaminans]